MTVVVFDSETTGLNNPKLVELASVIITPTDTYTFHSLCKPSAPIEDGAAAVHGITNQRVANERPDTEVAAEWWSDILSVHNPEFGPILLVAHNAPFDLRVLKPYVPAISEHRVLCTLKLSRRLHPHAPNHKLTTMHGYLGCTGEYQAHSALDDVYMCLNVLNKIAEVEGKNYSELEQTLSKPKSLSVMPFGKHKGVTFNELPKSYMTWMLSNIADLDPDVKYSMELMVSAS